jgi:hypothetical protein
MSPLAKPFSVRVVGVGGGDGGGDGWAVSTCTWVFALLMAFVVALVTALLFWGWELPGGGREVVWTGFWPEFWAEKPETWARWSAVPVPVLVPGDTPVSRTARSSASPPLGMLLGAPGGPPALTRIW